MQQEQRKGRAGEHRNTGGGRRGGGEAAVGNGGEGDTGPGRECSAVLESGKSGGIESPK